MRGQQVVANGKPTRVLLEEVICRNKIAERLRHLGAIRIDETVVHPEVCIFEAGCSRLRKLIFVMRKTKIEATAVNVKVLA